MLYIYLYYIFIYILYYIIYYIYLYLHIYLYNHFVMFYMQHQFMTCFLYSCGSKVDSGQMNAIGYLDSLLLTPLLCGMLITLDFSSGSYQ